MCAAPTREVVRRMGIEGDIRTANTTEVGMRFVNSRRGRQLRRFR